MYKVLGLLHLYTNGTGQLSKTNMIWPVDTTHTTGPDESDTPDIAHIQKSKCLFHIMMESL